MKEQTNRNIKEMIIFSRELSRATKQALENSLSEYGGNHFPFLERLYMIINACGTDGSISASILAQDLCMAPSALSRELRNLEESDLIVRRLDPTDRRKTLISISDKGEKQRKECEEAIIRYFSSVVEAVGDEDVQNLCRIHHKINAALQRRNSEWQQAKAVEDGLFT